MSEASHLLPFPKGSAQSAHETVSALGGGVRDLETTEGRSAAIYGAPRAQRDGSLLLLVQVRNQMRHFLQDRF